jgi:hypothetical protein
MDSTPVLGCTFTSANLPALAVPFCPWGLLDRRASGGGVRKGWERGHHVVISLHQILGIVKRQVALASCFGRDSAGLGRVPRAREIITGSE